MGSGCCKAHLIRKRTYGNESGENFGITVPRDVALLFSGVWLYHTVHKHCIVLRSGCHP